MRTLLLMLMVALSTPAVEVRLTDRILPLIQDGEGWKSAITVVNLSPKTAEYVVLFRTANSVNWTVAVDAPGATIDGPYVSGKLEPGASATIQTTGASEKLAIGHALLFSPDQARFGAKLTVRNAEKKSSIILPLSPEREDRLMLPFDNTEGASTSLLWLTETAFAVVDYSICGMDGKEISNGRYQFHASSPLSQEQFLLEERFPETKGLRGTVQLQISYPSAGLYDELIFTALAIQSLPDGPAFAVSSMSPDTWKASRH